MIADLRDGGLKLHEIAAESGTSVHVIRRHVRLGKAPQPEAFKAVARLHRRRIGHVAKAKSDPVTSDRFTNGVQPRFRR
ncbi:hypothetical protein [Sinorhizobium meliloti]|nr:hypothetical protein [Sinorhizobium meliloti]ASQ11087.1 hypothetical protein CDO22_13550 [Sinorhizobium meliloti]MQU85740.1 hypothetical protein [Sinorhizobium meliloti]MQU89276.1 hypothetical protein [Sinorhizobium meliloti]